MRTELKSKQLSTIAIEKKRIGNSVMTFNSGGRRRPTDDDGNNPNSDDEPPVIEKSQYYKDRTRMEPERIFAYSLLAFGAAAIVTAVWAYTLNEGNVDKWAKLPRNLIIGSVFAAIDLAWCVPHAKPLLPSSLHNFIIPTAIVFFFLGYFFLDYLFSRAIGGFLILLAYYFLQESFTHHTPALPLFSFFCYLMGIVGIFLCGKPYLLRDWIKAFPKEKGYRVVSAALCAAFGALSIILGFVHWTR